MSQPRLFFFRGLLVLLRLQYLHIWHSPDGRSFMGACAIGSPGYLRSCLQSHTSLQFSALISIAVFWGLFDRGDGLLTLTVITTFFYLITVTADGKLLERIAKTVAVVAGSSRP